VAGTPSIQDLPKKREYDLILKKYTGQTVPAGGSRFSCSPRLAAGELSPFQAYFPAAEDEVGSRDIPAFPVRKRFSADRPHRV